MSIISSTLMSDNLNFAINNISVTLTAVTPTNDETYVANKQDIETGFAIFEDGRETEIDTKFYLNIGSYTILPSKGTILTDGTTNYKVTNTHKDALNVTLRLDCSSQYQR